MASIRNFFNSRICLEKDIYFRFSFTPLESRLTIEDLSKPQIERRGQKCGRIDFSTCEANQLFEKWKEIMDCLYFTANVDKEKFSDDEDDDLENKVKIFYLIKPGRVMQRGPSRDFCGITLNRCIRAELDVGYFPGTLAFVQEQYYENPPPPPTEGQFVNLRDIVDSIAAGVNDASGLKETAVEERKHVIDRASIVLNTQKGVRKLNDILRLLGHINSLMFAENGEKNPNAAKW
jgi:hypothetical protein